MLGTGRQHLPADLHHWFAEFIGGDDTISLDNRELWLLLDSLPVAVLLGTDRACSQIVGNAAAQEMLQVPSGGNFSQSAPDTETPRFRVFRDGAPVPPDDLPMQTAARTGEPVAQSECEIRFEDGRSMVIMGHCIPVRNQKGETCGSIGSFIDVSGRMKEMDRANIVSREMSHRVKNNISIVQALSRMTIREHVDDEVFETFSERLMSLARFQELASIDHWESIALEQLCREAVLPVVGRLSDRVKISGPAVEVDAGAGSTFAMFLHELVTNACKYGALSTGEGRVELSWNTEPAGKKLSVKFLWRESGGPIVEKPARRGFGSSLVDMLISELHGGEAKIDFASAGVQAHVYFEVDRY